MEKRPVWGYVWFGTALRYLQDASVRHQIEPPGGILENIESFIKDLDKFNFKVTQRTMAYYDLGNLQAELMEMVATRSEGDEEPSLSAAMAQRLRGIMSDIRKTLEAEAGGIFAFVTTEKRLDIEKLLSDVRSLLTAKSYDVLPDIARHDLNEAGKCIAYERPTAAAFRLLRGTESVLRAFYCSIVKKQRVKPLLWDPMVASLRKRKNPPPAPLLENLTNIRRSFRNPTQHPEKIYDIEEVQDLFGLCVDVIRRMAAYL
jgi:hypothetical protein